MKLGGVCSILLAAMYVLVAVSFFAMPTAQNPTIASYTSEFFASVHENHVAMELAYWSLTLSAVFGIAAVAAISDLVRPANEGLVRWMNTLATVGFGIQIAANVLGRDYVLRTSAAYSRLEESAQAALNLQGNLFDDWIIFGLVGAWLMTVSAVALRNGFRPKGLWRLGLIGGSIYMFAIAARVFGIPSIMTIGVMLGGVILPAWFTWIGVRMLKGSIGQEQ